jgi:hypothetical protein
LCDGGSDDGRDDQTISGASLRTKSERQFQDGAGVDASFRRRVSGLSVRKTQPTGFSRWLLSSLTHASANRLNPRRRVKPMEL